ncbi:hypothetical protein NDU88_003761 [Pleurodeles waltl]|uniref:Uncharacterized protein n=1 Tax=Pleurodeles waltl TaxID=8319 RepID=A0AAV7T5W3_PLEWA|nr:hypothetical protein NDU88_003761 [Pleurodeles waltl]
MQPCDIPVCSALHARFRPIGSSNAAQRACADNNKERGLRPPRYERMLVLRPLPLHAGTTRKLDTPNEKE